MFFIPVGLFAAQAPLMGTGLTWETFFAANLLPVTLGNIIGGGVFVALIYGYVNRK
jgi:formate/nitrite transporter FocA (FNT family)